MINSVNTLEFLKPKLITMDKFNPTTIPTKLLPLPTPVSTSLTQTRSFVTFGNKLHQNKATAVDTQQDKQQQPQISGTMERVKVQHLENHAKLQNNNCWKNFHNLCNNLSASSADIKNEREDHVINRQINNNNVVVDFIKMEQEPKILTATRLHNNNYWNNLRTLCNNLNASTPVIKEEREEHVTNYCQINKDNVVDFVRVEQESEIVTASERIPIANNIQSKSAFKLDLNLNNMKYHNNTIYINNNNNNNNNIIIRNGFLTQTEINNSNNDQFYLKYHTPMPQTPNLYVESRIPPLQPQRTEDQNNAYRHIESVHNYAKLKYEDDDNDDNSLHGSRHSSSYLDDEEDDEENEDDDDDNNDDEVDEDYANGDCDIDTDYENILKRQRQRRRLQKLSISSDGAVFARVHTSRRPNEGLQKPVKFVNHYHRINVPPMKRMNNDDDEDAQIDVDVETVESQSPAISVTESLNSLHHQPADDSNAAVKPDHHARRPMNAFLIFCKRHRAIVKERYKNLENRAITKILGDWWASLDTNDKKCFTNLAQQNKDAFFTANPDFKWYKLPAPPLRTLTTRPAVSDVGQDYQEERDNHVLETISNITRNVDYENNNSNYFKLADEAQMGDLSQLIQEKTKTTMQQCSADLQQALGETSQFMSTHITGTAENLVEKVRGRRRRFSNENGFSSNSSEEDNLEPKKKSARSCKGKRYQELINSGQIVTAIKKSKSTTRLTSVSSEAAVNSEINFKQNFTNLNNNDSSNFSFNNNVCQKTSVTETDNIMSYDLNGFDLEERIKELPALDLDEYLQRKRNTKKKKKFSANGKKRGQRCHNNNSNNNNNDIVTNNNTNNSQQVNTQQQLSNAKTHSNKKQLYNQQCKTAVGSQKRKARKESITRRDISVIEQEVAAPLLPLTINGCCYFQEAPTAPMKYIKPLEKDTKTCEMSSSIIPLLQYPTTTQTSSNSNFSNNNNNSNILNDNIISSSTSDLLILAEVAANRTELKH